MLILAATTSLNGVVDGPFFNLAGTYTSKSIIDLFGVGETTNTTVTITEIGPNRYSISDVTASYHGAFGFNANQPVTVEVNESGDVVIIDNSGSQFDLVAGAILGSFDPNDGALGVLTLPWFDRTNNFGNTTIFTRTSLPGSDGPTPNPSAILSVLAAGGILKAVQGAGCWL